MARAPDFKRDVDLAHKLGLTVEAYYALSDIERDYQLAAWEVDRSKCPQCGNDTDVCSDPSVSWFPHRDVCYPTMARASADARYAALHENAEYHDGTFEEWGAERTRQTPFHFRDGVNIWVSRENLRPDDEFLG